MLKGFICPDGKRVGFEDCIRCNHPCLPTMIRIGVIKSHQYRGKSISATTITGCMRETFWKRTQDYWQEPTKLLYFGFRGTMIHEVLEKVKNGSFAGPDPILDIAIEEVLADYILEKRFHRDIEIYPGKKVTVSGKIDCYQKSIQELHDYKTMAAGGIYFLKRDGLKEAHILQLNFYKFILPFPVKRIQIHHLSMSWVATTGEEFNQKMKGKPLIFPIPEVPIWNDEKFLRTATPKIRVMAAAFEKGIVPPTNPGNNNWMCQNCPFTEECKQQGK